MVECYLAEAGTPHVVVIPPVGPINYFLLQGVESWGPQVSAAEVSPGNTRSREWLSWGEGEAQTRRRLEGVLD